MKLYILLFVTLVCALHASSTTTNTESHHLTKHVADGNLQAHSKSTGNEHDVHKHGKKLIKDSKHHVEVGQKGVHGSISHKIHDDEKALKKSSSRSETNHQSHKKAAAHQDHSGKFAEAAKAKKTAFSKGFHEKYHKNEHKKHDSFFDNGKKSGNFNTFGSKTSKHNTHKTSKVEHKNKLSVKSLDKHGKSGKKASGHKTNEHKGHKVSKGKNAHFNNKQQWGKKNQKPEDKQKYKYSQVHH